ncbi:hypothetical protein D3C72_2318860 [compost metagenome]
MLQNTAVSSTAASSVATSGARHQVPWRRRLNTLMSSHCESKNAEPDAMAMRTGASTSEAATATANPTHATRRACCGPWARLTSSLTKKATG